MRNDLRSFGQGPYIEANLKGKTVYRRQFYKPNYLQKAIVQAKLSRNGNFEGEIVAVRVRSLMAHLARTNLFCVNCEMIYGASGKGPYIEANLKGKTATLMAPILKPILKAKWSTEGQFYKPNYLQKAILQAKIIYRRQLYKQNCVKTAILKAQNCRRSCLKSLMAHLARTNLFCGKLQNDLRSLGQGPYIDILSNLEELLLWQFLS